MNNIKSEIPSAAEGSHDIYPLPHQTPRHCSGLQSYGFTLVELAIALMVIGLLIGGVLKGQELIENAQLTKFTRDLNDYNTATTIFQTIYGALPGNINNPSSRIPDCNTPPCSDDGNENGKIGGILASISTTPVPISTSPKSEEARRFWLHLAKSNLIQGGIDPTYTGTPGTIGVDFPATPLGGAFLISYINPAAGQPLPNIGHYFIVMGQSGITGRHALHTGSAGTFSTRIARKIDIKIDDGHPLTGRVSYSGHPACLDSAGDGYNPNNVECNIILQADF